MKPVLGRGLYIITDCLHLEFDDVLERTEKMLRAGVAAVQYRDKEAPSNIRLTRAKKLHELCKKYRVPLIVNDDIDAVLASGAEGLHVGRGDIECREARSRLNDSAIIGVSCYNSLERGIEAVKEGADYVAFGAMFPTESKQETVPATTRLLSEAKTKLSVPVVAIGGITPGNCTPLITAGADLLAVISSVYLASDPYTTVCRFNELMQTVAS